MGKNPFETCGTTKVWRHLCEVTELKGRWAALKREVAPERLQSMRRTTVVEGVGASMRLDSAYFADRDIVRLLASRPAWQFRSPMERRVAGYIEALEAALNAAGTVPLSEINIQQLHRLLHRYTGEDASEKGQYKHKFNIFKGFRLSGGEEIIRVTAPQHETPRRMREITGWLERQMSGGELHPLQAIPVFTAAFLALHPFQEANGPLSRLLTNWLLVQAGYDFVCYASLDREIERERELYVKTLRRAVCPMALSSDKVDWGPWTVFLLQRLIAQAGALIRQVENKEDAHAEHEGGRGQSGLPPLSDKIVVYARAHGRVDMGAMLRETGANRNTLKTHFRRLLEANVLEKHGEGRGAWYTPR